MELAPRDDQYIAETLLACLLRKAPTGKEQAQLVARHNQMQADYTWAEMAKVLSGALHDGYAFGNWPWTVRATTNS
jgi:hypothetical protein